MSKFIAKEGYFAVFLMLFLFFLVWIFYAFSFVLFFLFMLMLFLFRKPGLNLFCSDEKAILSPISGKITRIENITHQLLGDCVLISVKNAFYDCGVLVAPVQMRIENVQLKHGLFLCSELDAAKMMNERACIEATTWDKKFILQIQAGSMDRRLKLTPPHYTLHCGDELGFLLNGSVNLFLPRDTRVHIGLSDEIKAGSLLGYLT